MARGFFIASAAAFAVAGLICGCGDMGGAANSNPSGPTVERGVNVGELELYYDLSANEGTATFTPNVEAAGEAATISGIGVTGHFGKTIYDKRTQIPSLGAGTTGPACILGLSIASTGRYIITGPVLQVRMNQALNELYATYNGAKIGQNVTCLDVDDGAANPGAGVGAHAFLCENDWGYPAATGFGWSQTFEQIVGNGSDAEWTTVDVASGLARYHLYQIASGWTARTWAPAYELDGNSAGVSRRTAPDATPPNAVGLAMAFQLPLTTSNQTPTGIYIKGTLLADAIVDSHTLGADARWAPLGGGLQVGQSFDFDTERALAAGDIAKQIDRDASGRIYVGYSDGANVNVARLRPDLTAVAGDDEITPPLATASNCMGLDVVDEFSKIYVATGVPGTGVVNIFSIPADGANGTAVGTLDVGMVEVFGAGAFITDIVVGPNERMLYVAYGGAAADDGVVIGFALNSDGALTDNARDAMSAAGVFDAGSGGGNLALNPTSGSVYVTSGFSVAANGVSRLVPTTLGADGVYDFAGAADDYTSLAVSPTGVVYAAMENAAVAPYSAFTNPDTVGSNDVGVFSAAAVPPAMTGVVRFEENATYTTGSWLSAEPQNGALGPGFLFPGTDVVGPTGAPTDWVYWGDGAVSGTSKLLCLDDYVGAAGVNIAWVSM